MKPLAATKTALAAGSACGSRLALRAAPIVLGFFFAGASDLRGATEPSPGRDSTSATVQDLRRLIDDWEYVQAEALARRLLADAEALHGPRGLQAANVIDLFPDAIVPQRSPSPELGEMLRRAVAIKDSILGPDHPGLAVSLRALGRVQFATNDLDGARAGLERALAIQERALGPRHPEVATTLVWLGAVQRSKQQYDVARQTLERALAIREEALGPAHRDVAGPLMHLGIVAVSQRDMVRARECWERGLQICERTFGPEHRALHGFLNNLGALTSQYEGRDAEALPYFERALGIVEKLDPWTSNERVQNSYLNLLRNISLAHISLGDYSAARPYVERALEDTERMRGRDDYQYSQAQYAMEQLLLLAGDYAQARPLLEQLQPQQEGSEEKANVSRDLAAVEFAAGNLERADSLLALAQGIYERFDAPNPNEVNEHDQCRRLRAKVLLARGDHETATRVLQESLDFLPPEHAYRGETLASLGAARALAGDLVGAREHYTKALTVLEEGFGDKNPILARSLCDYARILARLGEPGEAFTAALRAENLGRDHLQGMIRWAPEQQALRFAVARASGLDAALSLAVDDPEATSTRDAMDAVVRSRTLVLDEIAWRHRVLADAADPETERLLGVLAATRRKLANVVVAGPRPGTAAERFRGIVEWLQKEKDATEKALAERSAEFQSELALGRAGLTEVWGALPSGSALVSFVRYDRMSEQSSARAAPPVPKRDGDSSYLAFVLLKGRLEPVLVTMGPAETVEARLREWHRQVSTFPGKSEAEQVRAVAKARKTGQALRELVWDPVATVLGDVQLVFVVPDGALHMMNLAALPVGESEYLVESGAVIHYLSAERDLLRGSDARGAGQGLLAIGGPAYDATSMFASLSREEAGQGEQAQVAASSSVSVSSGSDAPSGVAYRGQRSSCGTFASMHFSALPAARLEVEELVSRWAHGEVTRLTGPEATESAFKREAPAYRVVHVATHGFFLGGDCASTLAVLRGIGGVTQGVAPVVLPVGENPLLLSGLAFAGANHRTAAGPEEEDGILTAEEIASLDLRGVEWVVLSACETGVGEVKSGEGVFGLRRAFQVAGARTLVMSLWGVEDEATRRWMQGLYEARFAHGETTAAAVREASLAVLGERRERGEGTHPFYWGAFVAAGDWK